MPLFSSRSSSEARSGAASRRRLIRPESTPATVPSRPSMRVDTSTVRHSGQNCLAVSGLSPDSTSRLVSRSATSEASDRLVIRLSPRRGRKASQFLRRRRLGGTRRPGRSSANPRCCRRSAPRHTLPGVGRECVTDVRACCAKALVQRRQSRRPSARRADGACWSRPIAWLQTRGGHRRAGPACPALHRMPQRRQPPHPFARLAAGP